jgi:hypothetical protein
MAEPTSPPEQDQPVAGLPPLGADQAEQLTTLCIKVERIDREVEALVELTAATSSQVNLMRHDVRELCGDARSLKREMAAVKSLLGDILGRLPKASGHRRTLSPVRMPAVRDDAEE